MGADTLRAGLFRGALALRRTARGDFFAGFFFTALRREAAAARREGADTRRAEAEPRARARAFAFAALPAATFLRGPGRGFLLLRRAAFRVPAIALRFAIVRFATLRFAITGVLSGAHEP